MTWVGWVLFAAWQIWGVAVWVGIYRTWRSRGPEAAFVCLLMPWVAAALVFLVGPEVYTTYGGSVLPDFVLWLQVVAAVSCLGIGVSVGISEHPRWALPVWYRAAQQR